MHAVAKRLQGDLTATTLPELMQQLVAALQNSANAPQDPDHPAQVANLRARVAQVLSTSSVNTFSPVERQVLDEWGVSDILGNELAERIESIFLENQITIPAALQQVDALRVRIQELFQSLNVTG